MLDGTSSCVESFRVPWKVSICTIDLFCFIMRCFQFLLWPTVKYIHGCLTPVSVNIVVIGFYLWSIHCKVTIPKWGSSKFHCNASKGSHWWIDSMTVTSYLLMNRSVESLPTIVSWSSLLFFNSLYLFLYAYSLDF